MYMVDNKILSQKNRASRNSGSRIPNKNRATTCETSRAHHSCRAAEPARHNRSALGSGERHRHWPSVDDQRANDANRQRHVANDILAVCADDGAVEGVGIQGFVREAHKGNGRCTRGSFAFASVRQQLAEMSGIHIADAIAERFECYSRALSFAAVVASTYVRRSPVACVALPSSASSRCGAASDRQAACS